MREVLTPSLSIAVRTMAPPYTVAQGPKGFAEVGKLRTNVQVAGPEGLSRAPTESPGDEPGQTYG